MRAFHDTVLDSGSLPLTVWPDQVVRILFSRVRCCPQLPFAIGEEVSDMAWAGAR